MRWKCYSWPSVRHSPCPTEVRFTLTLCNIHNYMHINTVCLWPTFNLSHTLHHSTLTLCTFSPPPQPPNPPNPDPRSQTLKWWSGWTCTSGAAASRGRCWWRCGGSSRRLHTTSLCRPVCPCTAAGAAVLTRPLSVCLHWPTHSPWR